MRNGLPPRRPFPSRAVRLVLDTIERDGERHGVVSRVARQLDVGAETLRTLGPAGADRSG